MGGITHLIGFGVLMLRCKKPALQQESLRLDQDSNFLKSRLGWEEDLPGSALEAAHLCLAFPHVPSLPCVASVTSPSKASTWAGPSQELQLSVLSASSEVCGYEVFYEKENLA